MDGLQGYWLQFLIGTGLPILVAFITKQAASSRFKAIILAALAAISSTATVIASATGAIDWKVVLSSFAITFITAVAAHYGFFKPTGVTGTDGMVANAVPNGIGTAE